MIAGRAGADGQNGKDGKDGMPGLDGKNGIDGKDGKSSYRNRSKSRQYFRNGPILNLNIFGQTRTNP